MLEVLFDMLQSGIKKTLSRITTMGRRSKVLRNSSDFFMTAFTFVHSIMRSLRRFTRSRRRRAKAVALVMCFFMFTASLSMTVRASELNDIPTTVEVEDSSASEEVESSVPEETEQIEETEQTDQVEETEQVKETDQTEQTDQTEGTPAEEPSEDLAEEEEATTEDALEEEATEEEITDEEEAEELVAFEQSVRVEEDNVIITVTADEGVFPEGATLTIRKVSVDEENAVSTVIDQVRDDDANVAASYTYDITVYDEEGNEIQPNTENGTVKVTFQMDEIANTNLQTEVYHIEETQDGLSATDLSVDTGAGEYNEAVVETTGFSYYTVEFTYGGLQYVLNGDEKVELSTILDAVGIEVNGEITNVVGSNCELFAPVHEGGTWYIWSFLAFNTEEWLKVTIDGITYDIVVTDAILPSSITPVELKPNDFPYHKLNGNDVTIVKDYTWDDHYVGGTVQWIGKAPKSNPNLVSSYSGDQVVNKDDTVLFKIPNSFSYNGKFYDVYIKLTTDIAYTSISVNPNYNNGMPKGIQILPIGGTSKYSSTKKEAKDFDYELWLQEGDIVVNSNDVPFAIKTVWMAGYEYLDIYGNNDIVFSNYENGKLLYDNQYGWHSKIEDNDPDYSWGSWNRSDRHIFVDGHSRNHSVLGGYYLDHATRPLDGGGIEFTLGSVKINNTTNSIKFTGDKIRTPQVIVNKSKLNTVEDPTTYLGGHFLYWTNDKDISINGTNRVAGTPIYHNELTGIDNINQEYTFTAVTTNEATNHAWEYVASDNVLKAYCNFAGCSAEIADVANALTLTLSSDSQYKAGDSLNIIVGTPEEQVAWEVAGLTTPTLEYEGTGTTVFAKQTTAPTAAGTYKASITQGGATASVTFEIKAVSVIYNNGLYDGFAPYWQVDTAPEGGVLTFGTAYTNLPTADTYKNVGYTLAGWTNVAPTAGSTSTPIYIGNTITAEQVDELLNDPATGSEITLYAVWNRDTSKYVWNERLNKLYASDTSSSNALKTAMTDSSLGDDTLYILQDHNFYLNGTDIRKNITIDGGVYHYNLASGNRELGGTDTSKASYGDHTRYTLYENDTQAAHAFLARENSSSILQNIVFTKGNGYKNDSNGLIWLYAPASMKLKNVEIHDLGRNPNNAGTALIGCGQNTGTIELEDCYFHDNTSEGGIFVAGNSVTRNPNEPGGGDIIVTLKGNTRILNNKTGGTLMNIKVTTPRYTTNGVHLHIDESFSGQVGVYLPTANTLIGALCKDRTRAIELINNGSVISDQDYILAPITFSQAGYNGAIRVAQPATLTFNTNGATSGSLPTKAVVDGTETSIKNGVINTYLGAEVTLPGHGTLVKTDYSFTGWNTDEDGTGTDYTEGTKYTVNNEDETIYAKWESGSYVASVTSASGTTYYTTFKAAVEAANAATSDCEIKLLKDCSTDCTSEGILYINNTSNKTVTLNVDDKTLSLTNPKDINFDGWDSRVLYLVVQTPFTLKGNGGKIDLDLGGKGNVHGLYATGSNAVLRMYDGIDIHAKNGGGDTRLIFINNESKAYLYGGKVTVENMSTLSTLVNCGSYMYIYGGEYHWNVAKVSNNNYWAGVTDSSNAKEFKIYGGYFEGPLWWDPAHSPNAYTFYGGKYTTKMLKNNHNQKDGTLEWDSFIGGDNFEKQISEDYNGTHYSYEIGNNNIHILTFNAGDGVHLDISSKPVVEGATYGELPVPTKDGYVFGGWYTRENGTGKRIQSNDTVDITGNTNLYANWIPSGDFDIDYENEKIIPHVGFEISTSNGTNPTAPEGGKITPGGTYYVRKKGDDQNDPSDWTAITMPGRPAAPTGCAGVGTSGPGQADGKLTGVDSTMEYSDDDGQTWNEISGTPVTGLPKGTYKVRKKATADSFASESVVITIPDNAPATGEGYTIDYDKETITPGNDYEISTSYGDDANPPEGDKLTPGGTYYVRRKGDTDHSPSDWTTITIPSRPDAPTGQIAVNTSGAGKSDGKITNLPTGDPLEFSIDGGNTWIPVTGDEITGLPAGKVLLRKKATNTEFASNPVEITISNPSNNPGGSGHGGHGGNGGNGGGNGDSDGDSPVTPGNKDNNKTPIDFDKIKEDVLGEKTPDTTKKPGSKDKKKEETVEESQDVSQEETEENPEEEISKNPNSILEDFKLKDEDVQKLLDSDSPADKKVVDDMLDEAVKRELLQSDDTGRGNPNKDVSTGTIAEKDLRDLAKEVLTDDEIKQMLNGEPVNIGVEVKHNIKDPDYVKIASENKPKGSQIATIFDISVMKQIGDNGDVKVDGVNGTFEVNYLVPEEYRPTDGSMITYQIMRIYTDENGNLCTEIIDVKQDGFMLTYQADSDSKYVLLCNESAPLANVFLKEELKGHKCYIHWLSILVALIGTIVTLISKKRKAKIITAAVEGVLLIILIILGSCVWEYVVTVIGVLATVCAFLLNKKDQDKDEDAKAY